MVRSLSTAKDDGRLVIVVVADGVIVLREVPGEVVEGHLGQSLTQERDFGSSLLLRLQAVLGSSWEDETVLVGVVHGVEAVVVVSPERLLVHRLLPANIVCVIPLEGRGLLALGLRLLESRVVHWVQWSCCWWGWWCWGWLHWGLGSRLHRLGHRLRLLRLEWCLVACLRLVVRVVGGWRLVRQVLVGRLHRRVGRVEWLLLLLYVHRLRHCWPPGIGRGCRGKGLLC